MTRLGFTIALPLAALLAPAAGASDNPDRYASVELMAIHATDTGSISYGWPMQQEIGTKTLQLTAKLNVPVSRRVSVFLVGGGERIVQDYNGNDYLPTAHYAANGSIVGGGIKVYLRP